MPRLRRLAIYAAAASLLAAGVISGSVMVARAAPAVSASPHLIKGYAGMCVDDNGNSGSSGARVQVWACNSSDPAQLWEHQGGELIHDGMCANDEGWGGSGSHIILWTCNGAANEIWTYLPSGEFVLQANGGKLCLDDTAWSTHNGTQLIAYTCKNSGNQHWFFPVLGPPHLIKGYAGMCVDDNGNSGSSGARVQVWACNTSDPAQVWSYRGGELIHGTMCANDEGWGGSYSHVILWTCNGAANEIWSYRASGEFVLQANGGKLCLDDTAYSTRNGTQLIVYTCKNSSNQRWSVP